MATGLPASNRSYAGARVPDPVPNQRSDRLALETRKPRDYQGFRSGETRTRTGDTTIFSRVLYQLSYLAVGEKG